MGHASHLPPKSAFAQALNEYLAHMVGEQGGDVRSGRWLAAQTAALDPDAPKRTYWADLCKNEQTMTANDIATVAPVFGLSPYEFVRNTRRWVEGSNVTPIRTNVGPHDEGYEQDGSIPSTTRRAAKKRDPNRR